MIAFDPTKYDGYIFDCDGTGSKKPGRAMLLPLFALLRIGIRLCRSLSDQRIDQLKGS